MRPIAVFLVLVDLIIASLSMGRCEMRGVLHHAE